jgi:ADP-dependent NAD(P)H-hydrate dehydratase / NAD(P)H-hydrate epimerase
MRVGTAERVRELDRRTIEEVGIPGAVLMENAGRGATRILIEHFQGLDRGPVILVCGAGNNGGDGFVIARHLQEAGFEPRVFLLVPPDRIRGDARIYFDVLHRLDIPVEVLTGSRIPRGTRRQWQAASCIVDAIFGTGLARPVEGLFRSAIEAIDASRRPVFAVDLPSGICADTGRILGTAVHADCTATFGLPKRGLYLYPGAGCAGRVVCVDIGIPGKLLDELDIREETVEPPPFVPWLRREPDTHKGSYGHLFVLAGSAGKTGAACLCSEAALRCGAGLVTLGIPRTLNLVMEQKLTEVMTLPLPASDDDTLSAEGLDAIQAFASSVEGLVIGPGIGLNQHTERIARELWVALEKPMLWDADALTLLARNPDLRGKQKAQVVVTPHPGEMGRLIGKSASWVQQNRVEVTQSFAERWGVVTVLKGARTLIATPDGRLRINLTGNPGMAAGGMGDVLTGMIGGFLVQGMEPYDAASFGVWLHGAAGDRAARTIGPIGFLASEIMHSLPCLFRELMEAPECRTQR